MQHNPLDLSGKKFLITGASSGLGKASAILLSQLGAGIILADKNAEGLRETKAACAADTLELVIDLGNADEIKEKVTTAVQSFGKLNGFVHLAGRPYVSPLKSLNYTTVDEVIKINTIAALVLSKVFINRNISAEGSNSIVLISSVYGNVGSAANVGYALSKSALHGVAKSLAIELAPKKIRVNCIAPGFIKTKMLDDVSSTFNQEYTDRLNAMHPLGLGDPEDVAGAVAYLLSDMSKWVTGTILNVDGGFTAQ